MPKVFVSYSRKDIEFAKRLTAELAKWDFEYWIDWDDIAPTVDWWREIEKGIEQTDTFLFMISPDSAKSKICGREIATAAKNGKRIIPIVVRDIAGEDTVMHIEHLNYIFIREGDDFDLALMKLITAIQTDYEWVATHRRLQVKALEWERNSKEVSFLLRGRDLQEAELQLATNSSKDPHPTDLQREYVFESRKATDRQRRFLTSISVMGVIVLAVLTVISIFQGGKARNAEATAVFNEQEAKNQAAAAEEARALASDNAATAQANEEEAERQSQIALARQLGSQAQFIGSLPPPDYSQHFIESQLLAIESANLYPNFDAIQVLLNGAMPPVKSRVDAVCEVSSVVVFSPDGKTIASRCHDYDVAIWDINTGREVTSISYDGKPTQVVLPKAIQLLVFSLDGRILLSGGGDHIARIWNTETGELISQMAHKYEVTSINISPNGKWAISGSTDGTVIVWDAYTGQELSRFAREGAVSYVGFSLDNDLIIFQNLDSPGYGTESTVSTARPFDAKVVNEMFLDSVVFSPDNAWMAYMETSSPKLIHVKSVNSTKETLQVSGDNKVILFSSDGKLFATIDKEDRVTVWNISNGQKMTESQPLIGFYDSNNLYGYNAQITADASWLIVGNHVWDIYTGKILHTSPFLASAKMNSQGTLMSDGVTVWNIQTIPMSHGAETSPYGEWLLTFDENVVHLWNRKTNEESPVTQKNNYSSAGFSDDGQLAWFADHDRMILSIWELEDQREITRISSRGFNFAILSHDSERVAMINMDHSIDIREVRSGQLLANISSDQALNSVIFSNDGEKLAGEVRGDDPLTQLIRVYDTNSGKEIVHIPRISSSTSNPDIRYLVFSPDGESIAAAGGDGALDVWNTTNGTKIMEVEAAQPPNIPYSLAFSPDGKWVIVNYEFFIGIWDIASGEPVENLLSTTAFAVSKDGQWLATGYTDLHIWDIETMQEITKITFVPFTNSQNSVSQIVKSIAFSPDKKWIAAKIDDGTIHIWEIASQREFARSVWDRRFTFPVIVFSEDGKYIFSRGLSSTRNLIVWHWWYEDLIAEACQTLPRNLTRLEWQQYIGDALPYKAICPELPVEPEATSEP